MSNFLSLFLFFVFSAFSLNAIEQYQLINLGFLSYQKSEATSINSSGQICGTYKTKNKVFVFIWDPSLNVNYCRIRTLGKPLINEKGEIFGSQILHATDNIWDYEQEVPFCWKDPLSFFTFFNVSHLGLPREAIKISPFEYNRVVLWDINNQGDMLIMNSPSLKDFLLGSPRGFKYHVWIYHKGQYELINHPDIQVAFSMNNQSKVLGCYYEQFDKGLREHKIGSAIYDIQTKEVMRLPLPSNAIGHAINDLNQVIGLFTYPLTRTKQGFLCDSSDYFLVLENFHPIKANNKGCIVGKFLEGVNKGRAAIWDNGVLYDLSELVDCMDDTGNKWDSLDELVDINDEGYIIGQGTVEGKTHGFLLIPIQKQ